MCFPYPVPPERSLLKPRGRGRIRGAGEIFVEAAQKDVFVRRSPREQGHGRAEFHLVDRPEDVARASAFNIEREPRALPEPRAEDRMGEIGFRLVQRGDREPDRHGALSEAGDLGKDEPHPVALLPPDLQLLTNFVVERRLRVDEAFEIERVRHIRLLGRVWRPIRTYFDALWLIVTAIPRLSS